MLNMTHRIAKNRSCLSILFFMYLTPRQETGDMTHANEIKLQHVYMFKKGVLVSNCDLSNFVFSFILLLLFVLFLFWGCRFFCFVFFKSGRCTPSKMCPIIVSLVSE